MIVMENTSGDQAIFDGRGRGLISKKRFELARMRTFGLTRSKNSKSGHRLPSLKPVETAHGLTGPPNIPVLQR
jgi:hypothetical protein